MLLRQSILFESIFPEDRTLGGGRAAINWTFLELAPYYQSSNLLPSAGQFQLIFYEPQGVSVPTQDTLYMIHLPLHVLARRVQMSTLQQLCKAHSLPTLKRRIGKNIY